MKKRVDMQTLFRLAREERGVELVEFAIVAWVLMIVLFGLIRFGVALYSYHFTTYAAQEGSRFAMVRGASWSEHEAVGCGTSSTNFTMVYDCTALASDIQNYVQSLVTGGINVNDLSANTTWPGNTPSGTAGSCATTPNDQGCLVKVTVNYTFNFIPYLRMTAWSMSATSEKVILQ
jgi:Flp pilus assembly protein TadG